MAVSELGQPPLMAELGIIAPQGISCVGDLVGVLIGEDGAKLPKLARQALQGLAAELETVGDRVKQIDAAIMAWHKENEASRRLATIPGIGPTTASAIVATVIDPAQFQSARQVAAWIGLVPKQNSSGGKGRQGGISKQGDRYLRRLLVLGATAVIRHARTTATVQTAWLRGVLDRRPVRLASVADIIEARHVRTRFTARHDTFSDFAPLTCIEPLPAPANPTICSSGCYACRCSFADHPSLKLDEGTNDLHHHPARRGRGVHVSVT